MFLNILVCGDSFAADWGNAQGWTDFLGAKHTITNMAQAGVSEYKILKQVESVNWQKFDCTIIAHTSISRVHIDQHPLHKTTQLHSNCDLIYNDLVESRSKDPAVQAGIDYFKHIYDPVYYGDIYRLILDRIGKLCVKPTLHMTFFDNPVEYPFVCLQLKSVFSRFPGNNNHLNAEGNIKISKLVEEWIENVY